MNRPISVLVALAFGIVAGATLAAEVPLVALSVSGKVQLQRNGDPVSIGVGLPVARPVTLITGPGASLVLRAADGTQLSLDESSEVALGEQTASLRLSRGQVTLFSDSQVWAVNAAGTAMRAQGFLRLRQCAEGCLAQPGVYGKANGGEAVIEYLGGRSVMRERLFYLPPSGGKPEILAQDNGLLSGAGAATTRFDAAKAAKVLLAEDLKRGLDAFKAGNYDLASKLLVQLRLSAPGEAIVVYYLGLIALDQQRQEDALRLLQQYAKEDPKGAREKDLAKLLTLLTSAELQREVTQAVAQERSATSLPPEPGSIAVQSFVNRASPEHSALAKGIAAMVISDLAKVPGLKVLERQKMQKLAEEMRLSESGLVEADSALRMGRLLRAEKVLVGSIGVE